MKKKAWLEYFVIPLTTMGDFNFETQRENNNQEIKKK